MVLGGKFMLRQETMFIRECGSNGSTGGHGLVAFGNGLVCLCGGEMAEAVK